MVRYPKQIRKLFAHLTMAKGKVDAESPGGYWASDKMWADGGPCHQIILSNGLALKTDFRKYGVMDMAIFIKISYLNCGSTK